VCWAFPFGCLRILDHLGLPGLGLAISGLVVGAATAGLAAARQCLLLGVANGAFSIAAIGSMMALANQGRSRARRHAHGLWGAAQAIGFAVGGVLGTAASDVARMVAGLAGCRLCSVFAGEAVLFVVAAVLAARIAVPALMQTAAAPGRQEEAREQVAHL
jgi:BCD family chlorophyll transporter-like MFS transporter